MGAVVGDAGGEFFEDVEGASGGGGEGVGFGGVDGEGLGDGFGVHVGGQEHEFPFVDVGLVFDAGADVGVGVELGCVFFAVGEDGDEDLVGAVGVGHGGQAFADAVDGFADGVVEGGAAAGYEGLVGEGGDGLEVYAFVGG